MRRPYIPGASHHQRDSLDFQLASLDEIVEGLLRGWERAEAEGDRLREALRLIVAETRKPSGAPTVGTVRGIAERALDGRA